MNIIIEIQQANIYNNYKNTRLQLLKTNAAIWYNKICKTKQLVTWCETSWFYEIVISTAAILKNLRNLLSCRSKLPDDDMKMSKRCVR
jgi:hypothetical protein